MLLHRLYFFENFLEIEKIPCLFLDLYYNEDLSLDEWKELFSLASAHNVLPLIYQSVYMVPEVKVLPELRSKVRRLVMLQTMKTAEFLQVNQAIH